MRAQLRAAREVARQDPRWLRTWYWPLLLSVLVVGFTFGETIALVNRGSGGTATERVKAALGVDPPRRRRRVAVASFVAGLLGLVAWLIPHATGWPFTWPWE